MLDSQQIDELFTRLTVYELNLSIFLYKHGMKYLRNHVGKIHKTSKRYILLCVVGLVYPGL